ncbi:putative capsule polysaccharide export protein [Agrobacterium rubi TR3 = NBRC 13261]|uniref:Putative capsule polysaccharide export protein n=1 Tax=Agrobacterium rubi TR3 = NBRC 13261 TaxID=1368415 RepID=A0A081CYX7_9HYPH|nr:capsule biosynthesis protein [Agrobacterium rubi]MBP1880184.1 capsular polysaccharide transport system permease protein [Agrobacterium rubi]GAK71873.1 putative capsule polysaccharide export protein [Agrobacterium rubi TR3 = NBRC 13261]
MSKTDTKIVSDLGSIENLDSPTESRWLRLSAGLTTRLTARKSNQITPLDKAVRTTADDRGPPWMVITFFLIVIFPSILSLLYFVFVASNQYVAEARFAVRSLAEDSATENVDSGLMSMQASSQDANIVTSFIRSPEILRRLDGKIDYREMFANEDADFLARFDDQASNEEFLDYWLKHVSAFIDGPSGIVTLTAQTFRPEDSKKLVSAILDESEKLVNEMTVRAREDMLLSFRNEVTRTSKTYSEALTKVNSLQKQSGLLSPTEQAEQKSSLLTGLLAQKMDVDARMFVVRQSSGANSPSYRQLKLTRESLEDQIADLRNQLTGSEGASISNVITEFTALETDRLVAEKLYESARRNYDQALSAALKKALYITVFVNPVLPEEAIYPKRLVAPFLIFLGLVVLWSTLALVWASVEDHRL